jgi:hypothetical protein
MGGIVPIRPVRESTPTSSWRDSGLSDVTDRSPHSLSPAKLRLSAPNRKYTDVFLGPIR